MKKNTASKILGILLISTFNITNSRILILSDPKNTDQSFNFHIKAHAYHSATRALYVGADQAISKNIFSVAATNLLSSPAVFQPLTPETVTIDGNEKAMNPLLGKKISFLSLLDTAPTIVTDDDKQSIYFISSDANQKINVLAANKINDATGSKITNSIVGLTTSQPGYQSHIENVANTNLVFAAVTDNDGSFGSGNSGIAILKLDSKEIEDKDGKKITIPAIKILDAENGAKENKAKILNKSTEEVFITAPLTAITNQVVDMHWSKRLQKLYIALQGQSGSGQNDGIRSIVVGSIDKEKNKLIFEKILPDSALSSGPINDAIIAAVGPNATVNINMVRTMYTSTYCDYLIVVRDKKVFALPLVNNGPNVGLIADKRCLTVTRLANESFHMRTLDVPVQDAAGLTRETNSSAFVGKSEIFSNITDIFVAGDSVFISTAQSENNQTPGIFYSQAIFHSNGCIASWTPWQRAGGTCDQIAGFGIDQGSSSFMYISETQNVFRTFWGDGRSKIEQTINSAFPQKINGVQGIFDFPYTDPVFSQNIGARISLLIATGYRNIMLLQSGCDNNSGFFGADFNFDLDKLKSLNGGLSSYNPDKDYSAIEITGQAINSLGPIVAAEIAHDCQNAWLCVGGIGGLAILQDTTGKSWPAQGLQKNFHGLNPNSAFEIFGKFKNVRKLFAKENQLFVLTNSDLSRIDLSTDSIAQKNLDIKTLAISEELPDGKNKYFSDAILTGTSIYLATSSGLYGSKGNALNAASSTDMLWWKVPIAESIGPVTRLFGINTSDPALDVGNLYILNAYLGFLQARVYRYVLDARVDKGIALFPDIFFGKQNTFFINFGDYRNYFTYDGASAFISKSKIGEQPSLFYYLKPGPIAGNSGAQLSAEIVYNNLEFNSIGRLIRRSASGGWILSGDFGIRVNE